MTVPVASGTRLKRYTTHHQVKSTIVGNYGVQPNGAGEVSSWCSVAFGENGFFSAPPIVTGKKQDG